MVHAMKQVAGSTKEDILVFLLNFPVEEVGVWRGVLTRTFLRAEGSEKVKFHFVDDAIRGARIGGAIVTFSKPEAKVSLLHVEVLEAPADVGCVQFGGYIFYVELQCARFYEGDAPDVNIGLIWLPNMVCIGKPYFNESNYVGSVEMIRRNLVVHRYHSLFGALTQEYEKMEISMRAYLDGQVLITDMWSDYFNSFPVHQWKMSGAAHVVQGHIVEGVFQDMCQHSGLGCAPVCYKIRSSRRSTYWVSPYSFDFWRVGSEGDGNDTGAESRPALKTRNTKESTESIQLKYQPPVKEDEDAECMVCLNRIPTCVFESCGHLGVCGHCWKWMLL